MLIFLAYINWGVNVLITSFFIHVFLKPKKKNALKMNLVTNGIISTINFIFFYSNYLGKLIVFNICWLLITTIYYQSTFLQKILTNILILMGMFLSEVFMIFIVSFFFNVSIISTFSVVESVCVYLVSNVFLYINCQVMLRVFKKVNLKISTYIRVLIALAAQVNVIIYFMVLTEVSSGSYAIDKNLDIVQIVFTLIITASAYIFLSFYILRLNKKLYYELYEKIAINNKYLLQSKQLEEYQLFKDNEIYLQQVRHDIINFLQTKQVIQKED